MPPRNNSITDIFGTDLDSLMNSDSTGRSLAAAQEEQIFKIDESLKLEMFEPLPLAPRPHRFSLFSLASAVEKVESQEQKVQQDQDEIECNNGANFLVKKDKQHKPWDIICGRNHGCGGTVANRRFKITIAMNLQKYQNSHSREEKTILINEIANMLLEDVGARFLKPIGAGKYLILNEKQVREKVGHAIRDTIRQQQQPTKAARKASV